MPDDESANRLLEYYLFNTRLQDEEERRDPAPSEFNTLSVHFLEVGSYIKLARAGGAVCVRSAKGHFDTTRTFHIALGAICPSVGTFALVVRITAMQSTHMMKSFPLRGFLLLLQSRTVLPSFCLSSPPPPL